MKKRNMFRGARAVLFRRAFTLRQYETAAELLLWKHLKGKQLMGSKFRRQHPIDKFIVDFYCHKKKLIIEVDGGIHEEGIQKAYDIERENALVAMGYTVIRFKNKDVFSDLNYVIQEIMEVMEG